MKPPSDVQPSELFRRLMARPRPSEVVPFPGDDREKWRCMVLRVDQVTEANLWAERQLAASKLPESLLGGEGARGAVQNLSACQTVALAAHYPNPIGEEESPRYARLFVDGNEVAKALTADELSVMFSQYVAVQNKFGPYEGNLSSDADVNAWIQALKEGGSEIPLARLPSHLRDELLLSLAQRAWCMSQILTCPSENLGDCLGVIPQSWGFGTYSSTELAASFTHQTASDDETTGRARVIAETFGFDRDRDTE